MKLYEATFSDGSGLTGAYHNGGGIALLAESEEAAKARIKDAFPNLEWQYLEQITEHSLDDLLVFPNAGCC